jgi:hypothetical protein
MTPLRFKADFSANLATFEDQLGQERVNNFNLL